jgi:uncharacterized UBP type Zn finger protein
VVVGSQSLHLIGFICHEDKYKNSDGHYFAFVKDFNINSEKWFKANDVKVTEVKEVDVFCKKNYKSVYVLVYKKDVGKFTVFFVYCRKLIVVMLLLIN